MHYGSTPFEVSASQSNTIKPVTKLLNAEERIRFGSDLKNFPSLSIRYARASDFVAIQTISNTGIKIVGEQLTIKTFNKFLPMAPKANPFRHHQKILVSDSGEALGFIRANHDIEKGVTRLTHLFAVEAFDLRKDNRHFEVLPEYILEADLQDSARRIASTTSIKAGFPLGRYDAAERVSQMGYTHIGREPSPVINGAIMHVFQKRLG